VDNREQVEQLSALLDHGQAERFFRPSRGTALDTNVRTYPGASRSCWSTSGRGSALLGRVRRTPAKSFRKRRAYGPRSGGCNRLRVVAPAVIGERVRVTFRRRRIARAPGAVNRFEPRSPISCGRALTRALLQKRRTALSLLALTSDFGWLEARRAPARAQRAVNDSWRAWAKCRRFWRTNPHPLASLKATRSYWASSSTSDSPLQRGLPHRRKRPATRELTSTLLDLVRASRFSRRPTDPAGCCAKLRRRRR